MRKLKNAVNEAYTRIMYVDEKVSSQFVEMPTQKEIFQSLSILAKCQSEGEKNEASQTGVCIVLKRKAPTAKCYVASVEGPSVPSTEEPSVPSTEEPSAASAEGPSVPSVEGPSVALIEKPSIASGLSIAAEVFSCTYEDLNWMYAVARSARTFPSHTLFEAEVYCSPHKGKSGKGTIVVDLLNLTAEGKDASDESTNLLFESKQSFSLAVDDYFMAVAILCKELGDGKGGACIVSNDSLHVVSIGYCKEGFHAELLALLNTKGCRVDPTKCSLYTTEPPCRDCTEAILQAGIRVVVYGDVRGNHQLVGDSARLGKAVYDLVYKAKACFKKYECCIRVQNEEKKFLIDLFECVIQAKALDPPAPPDSPDPPADQLQEASKRPSYRDFFMAMAFLAHTRSKDIKYQVGACLVTPSPHRLVAMGYNGMPDGRGFKDNKMDWGSHQSKYICHAELNAIIAAFRREADLSACTLYVTHSPCEDCSKLVAQSGIKNLVFAKYYANGKAMYETLGRLPDMNITRYDYKESGYGNIARILINLDDLTSPIEMSLSSTIPQTELEIKDDDNDGKFKCPQCLSKDYKKPENNTCPTCKKSVPKLPKKKPKGRREVDFPLDDYFMSLAVLATCRSHVHKDKRFGACLIYQEPRRAISVGYTGYIDGLSGGKKEEEYVCCAEFNAIVSAFRYHADLTTATLYTTGYPCARCATMIVQSGIKTVVHGREPDKQNEETAKKYCRNMTEPEEIFYWGKVATLKYEPKTSKPCIEIDLRGLIVDQRDNPIKEEAEGDNEGD